MQHFVKTPKGRFNSENMKMRNGRHVRCHLLVTVAAEVRDVNSKWFCKFCLRTVACVDNFLINDLKLYNWYKLQPLLNESDFIIITRCLLFNMSHYYIELCFKVIYKIFKIKRLKIKRLTMMAYLPNTGRMQATPVIINHNTVTHRLPNLSIRIQLEM